jgi:hypothetical protein
LLSEPRRLTPTCLTASFLLACGVCCCVLNEGRGKVNCGCCRTYSWVRRCVTSMHMMPIFNFQGRHRQPCYYSSRKINEVRKNCSIAFVFVVSLLRISSLQLHSSLSAAIGDSSSCCCGRNNHHNQVCEGELPITATDSCCYICCSGKSRASQPFRWPLHRY